MSPGVKPQVPSSRTLIQTFTNRNTEAMLCRTYANGVLVNESTKYNYYRGVTILQKLLIKRLNRKLINSVNSYKL